MRLISKIQCKQCGGRADTLYQSKHNGRHMVDDVKIDCGCGYLYVSRCEYRPLKEPVAKA